MEHWGYVDPISLDVFRVFFGGTNSNNAINHEMISLGFYQTSILKITSY